MKKITVFSAPKPFTDRHIDLVQRNAIHSWLKMGEGVEILLVGDEAGIADAASDLHVTHVSDVKRNEQGTPLVSSIFELAHQVGHADLLLFTNSDMLFFPETLEIAFHMQTIAEDFVLLGRRYDLDVNEPLGFSNGWGQRLRAEVQINGRLHPLGGSDYFIFPRRLFQKVPDFAIGRAGWDNWMIYHALSRGWLVVDATPSLMVIHQNHDYGHLGGDRSHQRHPETRKNLVLAGGMRKMFSLLDVKFRLVDGQIQPIPWSLPRALHQLEQRLQPDELVGRGPRWWLLRGVRKLRRALQGAGRD